MSLALFTLPVALFTLLLHTLRIRAAASVPRAACSAPQMVAACVNVASLVVALVGVAKYKAKGRLSEHGRFFFRPARSKVFRSGPPRRRGGPETSSYAFGTFLLLASVFTVR